MLTPSTCVPVVGASEYAPPGLFGMLTELIVSGALPAFLTVTLAGELDVILGTPRKLMLVGWTSILSVGDVPEPVNEMVCEPELSDSTTGHDEVPPTAGLNVPVNV